jgi:ribonuclease-3
MARKLVPALGNGFKALRKEWRLARRTAGSTPGSIAELQPVSPARRAELRSLQRRMGVRFRDERLMNLSLCHRSYTAEAGVASNERLEFLGDAVLGLVASQWLYRRLEGRPEGDLSRVKSVVVSEESLARIARQISVDRCLLLGRGEERSGGRGKSALLADALEALIGACYLDSGLHAAEQFVERLFVDEIEKVIAGRHRQDYKTLLQELSQKRFQAFPKYRVTERRGPDHDQVFSMDVVVAGRPYGPAEGKSKKQAEQRVARIAYAQLVETEADSGESGSGGSTAAG